MSDRELRALEREYRQKRAEILGDESVSWEKRMRRISELYAHYLDRCDALRGAAQGEAEEDGAA